MKCIQEVNNSLLKLIPFPAILHSISNIYFKIRNHYNLIRPTTVLLETLINNNTLIKAASSDGRDLAPGSLPTGGFRKTGNGEQYAFRIANIEGYVKVI